MPRQSPLNGHLPQIAGTQRRVVLGGICGDRDQRYAVRHPGEVADLSLAGSQTVSALRIDLHHPQARESQVLLGDDRVIPLFFSCGDSFRLGVFAQNGDPATVRRPGRLG